MRSIAANSDSVSVLKGLMTSYISNDLMNTITNNYITIECSDYHIHIQLFIYQVFGIFQLNGSFMLP